MNPFPLASLAVALLSFAIPASSEAQDLFQRSCQLGRRSSSDGELYRGRDRLDLRMGGELLPELSHRNSNTAELGVGGTLDVDFACGKFDVNASLKSLFGKEARSEFTKGLIDYALSELTGSALTLLCEASPTACQVFQHHRINANAMLKVNYDWCQAVEQGIDTGLQSAQASAIKDCMAEKQRQGMAVDDAKKACQTPSGMRGFGGVKVPEIKILDELVRALRLAPEEQKLAQEYLSDVSYSTRGSSGTIRPSAVSEAFENRRKEKYEAWEEAFAQAASTGTIAQDLREKLGPKGARQMLVEDMRQIASLSPKEHGLFLNHMATEAAFFEVELEVANVERWLTALRRDPQADKGTIQQVERQLADLESEMAQLRQLRQAEDGWNRELLRMTETLQKAAVTRKATEVYRTEADRQGNQVLKQYPKIGAMASGCCERGAAGGQVGTRPASGTGTGVSMNFGMDGQ